MKKRIIAAEDTNNDLDDALKDLKEDFDYVMSGLDKLGRSGPNATKVALSIAENLSSDLANHMSDIADSISR